MTAVERTLGMTPAERREVLSPAVRARTILATSRNARLVTRAQELLAGGEQVPASHVLSIVDDGGEPVLLLPDGHVPVNGIVTLHLEAPALGRLVLMGRAAPAGGDVPGTPGPRSRLAVTTVGVAPGPEPCGPGVSAEARRTRALAALRLERVDLDAYVTAEPDLWAALGDSLLAHLTGSHGPQLLELARRQGAPGAHFATARSIDPGGLTLTVADDAGVGQLRVAFAGAAPGPMEALQEIARYLH